MKKTIYTLVAASMFVVLSGCGGAGEAEANDRAEELCACLTDAGLDDNISVMTLQSEKSRKMMEKMEEDVPKCAIKVLKGVKKDIDGLKGDKKKEYMKAFLKGIIDTECSDIILGFIPYEMMGMGIDEAERMLDRENSYDEEDWDDEEWEEEGYDDYGDEEWEDDEDY